MLGLLSWTAEVEIFRLGIPAVYEHMLAYALFAIILIVAKGLRAPSLTEVILVVLLSAMLEALKYTIPFRHPKTSDFFADMLGIFAMITIFYLVKNIARLTRRAIQFLLFPPVRSVDY